ncbi:MAG: cupredoxin domain-containing protein [Deltaproteobacteria bacterium]|nr:cupredoxin domain-containing protein [Deltaproteobacteria bacterium]MBW2360252.1 cupredoxin domain-containing protein [Deltaproteobacteria bacterium]
MTRSHRTVSIGLAAFACALLAGAFPVLAEHHEGVAAGPAVIQVVSTNVQGKNVYIPSTIVVEAGKPAALSVFNTTETPHGFSITGAGIEEVLIPGQEHPIELPALEPGSYPIYCQLHPAHRGGRLVVIDF